MKMCNIAIVVDDLSTGDELHRSILCILGQDGYSEKSAHIAISGMLNAEIGAYLKSNVDFLNKNHIFVNPDGLPGGARMTLRAGDMVTLNYLSAAVNICSSNAAERVVPEYVVMTVSAGDGCFYYRRFNDAIIDDSGLVENCADDNKKAAVEILQDTAIYKIERMGGCGPVEMENLRNSAVFWPQRPKLESAPAWMPGDIPEQEDIKTRIGNVIKKSAVLEKIVKSSIRRAKLIGEAAAIHGKERSSDNLPLSVMKMINSLSSVYLPAFVGDGIYKKDLTKEKHTLDRATRACLDAFCGHMKYRQYDYVLVVPWIIAGGADMFAINYANTFAKKIRDKRVLVVATEHGRKSLPLEVAKLSEKVDFLPLGEYVGHFTNKADVERVTEGLLGAILANVSPKIIHVLLSKLGYKYILGNASALRRDGTKILLTAYNYIELPSGRIAGYSVSEVPSAAKYADFITTDSQTIADMWVKMFGIEKDKILVHKQPFAKITTIQKKKHAGINILWAAHIRKEKNPDIVPKIARELGEGYRIDCYGELDRAHYRKNPFLKTGAANLHYMGSFRDFFGEIDLGKYDAMLYTSKADGTPNIIIQAGLAKCPIISSAIGGIPDLIGADGILVADPDDAESFVRAIKQLSEKNIEMAERLHDRILATHSQKVFDEQVSALLSRLKV